MTRILMTWSGLVTADWKPRIALASGRMTTSGFGDDDRRITIGLEDGEHVEADPEHHRERQWDLECREIEGLPVLAIEVIPEEQERNEGQHHGQDGSEGPPETDA